MLRAKRPEKHIESVLLIDLNGDDLSSIIVVLLVVFDVLLGHDFNRLDESRINYIVVGNCEFRLKRAMRVFFGREW